MASRNLMIVQGGGPTAVFNASLAAAITEARRPNAFARIFGARSGSSGLARGLVSELTDLSPALLESLRHTPGAALGSSRFRPTDEDLHRQLQTLKHLGIRDLLFMGGNGTMRGADLFADFCASSNYPISAIGVPKTIDNDLAATDRCPGYSSAARYVVQSTQELGQDIRSLPQPVTIFETMGRSVGWLAAAAALAGTSGESAPQLILIPEIPFDQQRFLSIIDDAVARRGWAVAVVAEGICHHDGSLVYSLTDPAQQDSLQRPLTGGVARHLAGIVAANLKLRCRSEIPGLLGRSSMAHRSDQDLRDATDAATAAVQALLAGETGKMVALTPVGSRAPTTLVPFQQVAGIERPIPQEWLDHGPLAVTDAFRKYLRPLVGALNHYAPELPATPALSLELTKHV